MALKWFLYCTPATNPHLPWFPNSISNCRKISSIVDSADTFTDYEKTSGRFGFVQRDVGAWTEFEFIDIKGKCARAINGSDPSGPLLVPHDSDILRWPPGVAHSTLIPIP